MGSRATSERDRQIGKRKEYNLKRTDININLCDQIGIYWF